MNLIPGNRCETQFVETLTMDRHVKYGVVLAALVAALAFALDAQASISTGGPPDYYLLTNMANWQANGAVDQQDKVWAFGSSTLAPPVGGGPGSVPEEANALTASACSRLKYLHPFRSRSGSGIRFVRSHRSRVSL